MTIGRGRHREKTIIIIIIFIYYYYYLFFKPSKNEDREKIEKVKKNGETNVPSGRPTQNYCYYYYYFN